MACDGVRVAAGLMPVPGGECGAHQPGAPVMGWEQVIGDELRAHPA